MNTICAGLNSPRSPLAREAAASPSTGPATGCPADAYVPTARHDVDVLPVPSGWTTQPAVRQAVCDQLLKHLSAWPCLHAVVAVGPRPDGNSALLVASRPDAASQSEPAGIFGVVSALAGSPSMHAGSGVAYEAPRVVAHNGAGDVHELRLVGTKNAAAVAGALSTGRQPNQREQLKTFLQGLPQGERVVVLLAGPSGAGKTTLISDLQALAGDRKVVSLTGDMYFRDVDDPDYPRTPQGTLYFDSPDAMHMDELAGDIAKLLKDGKADVPVYDFAASRPGGWRTPVSGVTGIRLDRKDHLELGADDILVIDSVHAANQKVVAQLQKAALPQFTLYLDSQKAEDRLLRRIVRDFAQREGSADRTLQFWDLTTFPGEVHFVRPTMLEMDVARDLSYVTKFNTDLGLSRPEIEHKVHMLDEWGLAPTYAAFGTPDDGLSKLAASEKDRCQGVLRSGASDADKAVARRALDRLESAPRAHAG